MNARVMVACLLAGGSCFASADTVDTAEPAGVGRECAETEAVRQQPPSDPGASDFGHGPWYINANRTMWADPWHPWSASPKGIKVLWIRPVGEQLRIAGRRLDGSAPALAARIPCCYRGTYQSTRLTFPTAGCWEIAASAGSESLTFIVAVGSAPPAGSARQ